jgi:XTP/dITP diphosphohydrolase
MLNLVIATTNKGKMKEFRQLLENLPVSLKSLDEFGNIPEPLETGRTFMENAELKATFYALKTNSWTVADDSGLEVEALENAPGVYSARYAGENTDETSNIAKLLRELEKTTDAERNARFVCEMAVADETGRIIIKSSGVCAGKIALKPSGIKGFGYDPIFIPNGYSESFGELSERIKQRISHRSAAAGKIIRDLSDFLAL